MSEKYPELHRYDEENCLDLDRPLDDTPIEELGRYEITFEAEGKRFYCFVDAITMNEALGQFFRWHPHITYEMVIEHMEV